MTSAPEAHKTPEVLATVRPLDFANALHHAFEAGKSGIAWPDYDGDSPAVDRINAALSPWLFSTPSVPAVAELSEGLALGVAGAAEGNLLTAAKKALAFYDGLDREHDPGEAAVLDALDTAVRAALTASPAGDDPKALDAATRYVRHKKRGTTYRVIGVGKMQAENWSDLAYYPAQASVDMAEVVTYQCLEDGALWVRPVAEFNDGRFEDVPAPERFAAVRSSSAEAVEQERPAGHFAIDHDGFAGTVIGHYMTLEGKQGVVLQQDGTRVVHVYGEKWLKPSPVPATCKPEGETHG